MKTPLEYWLASPDDQRALEAFINSENGIGYRLFRVLEYMNRATTGTSNDYRLGWQACLDSLPNLFFTTQKEVADKQAAQDRNNGRNILRNTGPNNP